MLLASFFNTSNTWSSYFSNLFFAAAGFAAVGRIIYKFITRHNDQKFDYLEEKILENKQDQDYKFEKILNQYKSNGGSSPKDQWNRLENKVDHLMDIEKQVDKLSQLMDRHLGYHEGLRAANDEEE
jgi:hypothetical protein